MDIYLRVEQADRPGEPLGDVTVRVEPSHMVEELAVALAACFGTSGGGTTLGRPTGSFALDAAVETLELVSGETLILGTDGVVGAGNVPPGPWPATGPQFDLGPELVVASGPDAGARCRLTPGDITLGRDPACDLSVSDPQVSRQHLQVNTATDGTVTVRALTQANHTSIDGDPLQEVQGLSEDNVVRVGGSTIAVRTSGRSRSAAPDSSGQIPFHRTPYFAAAVPSAAVAAIDEIPTTPDPPRFGYLSAALPLLVGIGFALLFGPRYLLFALFSPVMLIGAHIEQRRRSGRRFSSSVARFDDALVAKQAEVAAALAVERRRRFDAAPDLAALADRVVTRSADLWVRHGAAEDFLSLRFGIGDVPARLVMDDGHGGDEEFREQMVEALGEHNLICDVPVGLSLTDLGVIALVGRTEDTTALVSSLALQATCLHSPEELVVLAAVAPDRHLGAWLKWLPHTRSASSPLGGRHLAATTDQANELIAEVVDEATRRSGAAVPADGPPLPHLLVVLDRALEPDAALTSRLLDIGPPAGISVLWLTDSRHRVPRQATAVVTCRPLTTTTPSLVSFTEPDRPDQSLDLERAGHAFVANTARAMAPLRDASFADATASVPRVVPLFAGLGVSSVDADWVMRQWKRESGYSLAAPVGHTESGPLLLDLVEHGPHALIGGTSGAGKSELVMSIVAGLIAHHPPSAVNLLFIDYKGGASSELFVRAPHTVGYVTNLDGLLAKRALISLRAELHRRMALMEGKAKDMAELIERFPEEAPPSLVIVVDEFATLAKEVPDFVAGIVDVAQRGRSLGIHLLLATQRPSGALNDNITANTNLRLSLRMLDGAESSSVIGTTAAAAIPVPLRGRGYVKVGSAEPVAFQSSWAGAPLLTRSGAPPVTVSVFADNPDTEPSLSDPTLFGAGVRPGAGVRSGAAVAGARAGTPRTQADALLEAVALATERLGLAPGRPPWLEVLSPTIDLDAIRPNPVDQSTGTAAYAEPGAERVPGAQIAFGMVDDPAAQAQYPAVVDLASSGGLIISGAGGSGKSTLLQTLAVSAAMDDVDAGSGTLSIFAIDFASRALVGLRRLPQCGGVATGNDIEAVTRTIDVLFTELQRRRNVGAEAMANGEPPPPLSSVLLLIDGIDAVIHAMEQDAAGGLMAYQERLTTLITDGRQVGMYPVIASTRRAAIRSTLTSAISDRITLRQADAQGYVDCGIGTGDAAEVDLGPGQGFLNGPTLVQVALPGEWTTSVGLVAAELQSAALPVSVPLGTSDDPLQPTVGLTDITSRPYQLDLRHDDVLVVGDPRSGRSTTLVTIGRQAAAAGAELWAVGRPGSPLASLSELSCSCFAVGDALADAVEAMVARATDPTVAPAARLLLVDDYDLLPEHCRRLGEALPRLLSAVRYVAAGPTPRAFSPHPMVQAARNARSMIYLRPRDGRDAHEITGVPVAWRPGVPMVEGRGYAVVDRTPTLVQFSNPA